MAWLAAASMESMARVTGRAPAVPLTAVRMAKKRMYFSVDKAVRELGLPQTSVEEALRDAVDWFVERGYVGPRRTGAA
jgi:dihydroflavonol-4-reductase